MRVWGGWREGWNVKEGKSDEGEKKVKKRKKTKEEGVNSHLSIYLHVTLSGLGLGRSFFFALKNAQQEIDAFVVHPQANASTINAFTINNNGQDFIVWPMIQST